MDLPNFRDLYDIGSDIHKRGIFRNRLIRLPLETLRMLKTEYERQYTALLHEIKKLPAVSKPEWFAQLIINLGFGTVAEFTRNAPEAYKKNEKGYTRILSEAPSKQKLNTFFIDGLTARIQYLQERELPTVILVYANDKEKTRLRRMYGNMPAIDIRENTWQKQFTAFPARLPLIIPPEEKELRKIFPLRRIVFPTYTEERIHMLALILSYLEGKELIHALRSLPPEEAVRILQLRSILTVPPVEYDSDQHHPAAPPGWPCAPLVAIDVPIGSEISPNDPTPINTYLQLCKDLHACMKRGDVVINVQVESKHSYGVFLWDGKEAVPLVREEDKSGMIFSGVRTKIPSDFGTFTEFPFGYFLQGAQVRNHHINLTPYREEILRNMHENGKPYFTVGGKRYGVVYDDIDNIEDLFRARDFSIFFATEGSIYGYEFADLDIFGIIVGRW